MPKHKPIDDALNRLAAAEEQFLASEFLAPALRGGEVHVRISGVVCALGIEPADFEGWGVFRPADYNRAILVRDAKLSERQRYLELFPLLTLVLVEKHEQEWLAVPAHRGDSRFHIEGLVPVRLIEDAQSFEVVRTRFDGAQFWYDGPDPTRDPATAALLRAELQRLTPPEKLARSGLTPEEREAYAALYRPRYEASEEAQRAREEKRLRDALAHAGATLKDYKERRDVYTVTYEVDGRRHVSAVSKRTLSVQVAGICLSGEDAKFDLQSLVGVIREGQGSAGFVRVGQENRGMPEAHYWRVHPPR